MSVLEKDVSDQKAVEKARRVEEERLTQQEMLYQVQLTPLPLVCFKYICCFMIPILRLLHDTYSSVS